MFIIIRLYFLETVSNDPCGGAVWRRRSCSCKFFFWSSGLCSFCFLMSALPFYDLSWESVQAPELMENYPYHLPVPLTIHSLAPCSVYLPFRFLAVSHSGVYIIESMVSEEKRVRKRGMVGGKKRWQVSSFWTCGLNMLVKCFCSYMVGKFGNVQHRGWGKNTKLLNNNT